MITTSAKEKILYDPYSIALIKENNFFERCDGCKGKVVDRFIKDRKSVVRWSGGKFGFVIWDDGLKYYKI